MKVKIYILFCSAAYFNTISQLYICKRHLSLKHSLLYKFVINADFIQVMITKGVDAMKGSEKQIAVTNFWRRCRTAFDEKTKPKPDKPETPHSTDQEIPAVDAATIIAAWEKRHNFMLTDSQLLTPFQQGRLWRESTT